MAYKIANMKCMEKSAEDKTFVQVRFATIPTPYIFDPGELSLTPGDMVVVNTEIGQSVAKVIGFATKADAEGLDKIKPVVRKLTKNDDQKLEKIRANEKECFEFCHQRILARELPMKLSRVEQSFDGNKTTFFFVAEGRVDFRELLKDLVERFKSRIELRQIGTRQEAAIVGGIGSCGRVLCCTSYLTDFQRISVKMAKTQNMTLNPTKISGLCGKLKCCLAYEQEAYAELNASIPKPGKKIFLDQGEATIVSINVISQTFIAKLQDRRFVKAKPEDIITEEEFLKLSEEKVAKQKEEVAEMAKAAAEAKKNARKEGGSSAKKKRPPRKRRKKRSNP